MFWTLTETLGLKCEHCKLKDRISNKRRNTRKKHEKSQSSNSICTIFKSHNSSCQLSIFDEYSQYNVQPFHIFLIERTRYNRTRKFNAQSYSKLKIDSKVHSHRNEYFVTSKVFVNDRGINLRFFTICRLKEKFSSAATTALSCNILRKTIRSLLLHTHTRWNM